MQTTTMNMSIFDKNIYYFKRNDDEIKVAKRDSEILIEIENLQTFKLSSTVINAESAILIDPFLFSTFEDLYYGINTALSGKDESIVVKIDHSTNMHFTWTGIVGKAIKPRDFEIVLKEKSIGSLEKCERDLAKLKERDGDLYNDRENNFLKLFGNFFDYLKKKENEWVVHREKEQEEIDQQLNRSEADSEPHREVLKNANNNNSLPEEIEKCITRVTKLEEELQAAETKIAVLEASIERKIQENPTGRINNEIDSASLEEKIKKLMSEDIYNKIQERFADQLKEIESNYKSLELVFVKENIEKDNMDYKISKEVRECVARLTQIEKDLRTLEIPTKKIYALTKTVRMFITSTIELEKTHNQIDEIRSQAFDEANNQSSEKLQNLHAMRKALLQQLMELENNCKVQGNESKSGKGVNMNDQEFEGMDVKVNEMISWDKYKDNHLPFICKLSM